MEVAKVFTELNQLKMEVQAGLHKIGDIEFDKDNIEARFLSAYFNGVMSDMDYIVESMDYISKPVMKEGVVNGGGEKLFIDDFELQEGDTVEYLIGGTWEQADIFKIRGSYRNEYLFENMKDHQVMGRIRLTEEELRRRRACAGIRAGSHVR